jgi:hypothetical protein
MNAISQLMAADGFLWVVGGMIAIVGIFCGTVTSMVKVVSRERSRREIAAYIAEGSLTPEQGERLMNAGEKPACS